MDDLNYLTRWVLSLDDKGRVDLERKLVPFDNPIDFLLMDEADDLEFNLANITIHGIHFAVIYKEIEEYTTKSVIYVGRHNLIGDEFLIADLDEDDEAYIETLADLYLREKAVLRH